MMVSVSVMKGEPARDRNGASSSTPRHETNKKYNNRVCWEFVHARALGK